MQAASSNTPSKNLDPDKRNNQQAKSLSNKYRENNSRSHFQRP